MNREQEIKYIELDIAKRLQSNKLVTVEKLLNTICGDIRSKKKSMAKVPKMFPSDYTDILMKQLLKKMFEEEIAIYREQFFEMAELVESLRDEKKMIQVNSSISSKICNLFNR